jgi:hypothetical protein
MLFTDKYYDIKYGHIIASALRQDGKVYSGKCHADCFMQEDKGILRNAEQGFITYNGVFVNRKQALKIAKHYNQIKQKHSPEDELMSEDLI